MKEQNYAINICLIPDIKLSEICNALNILDTDSRYNLNSRTYIPHCTLVMKYISKKDLENIIAEEEKLELQKIETSVWNYYANSFWENDIWTWIYLEKNPSIFSLQQELCEITKKYKNTERTKDYYAIDDFFEEHQIPLWTEEDFLSNKHIHITLGKADMKHKFSAEILPQKCMFEKIVIGHMWNYGSVREILFEKSL